MLRHKGEFTNDVVLLACSRQGATDATKAYVDLTWTNCEFSKTKFLAMGDRGRQDAIDGNNNIECVNEFPYFGSFDY